MSVEKGYMPAMSIGASVSGHVNNSVGFGKVANPSEMTLPWFFYRLMLGNQNDKNYVINRAPIELLNEVIEYIQEPKLKRKIYKHMRFKVQDRTSSRSVIVNEISGIYSFVTNMIDYGLITARMYLDS